MRKFATIAIALSILALGCNDVKSGTVVSKDHQAAYTYIQMNCAVYGKYGCTTYVPIIISVPESWSLDLQEDDASGKPIKDRTQGSVSVSQNDWDRYHLGQHYP